jgi:MFS family permease
MQSPQRSPNTFSRLPKSILALGMVSLFMDVSSELIHSLLPVFMVGTLGASAFALGLIEGAAESVALIVKVFSGAISDYFGKRKPLALLGYGMAALTKPLFALAPGIGMVLVARLLDRVGKGIRGAPRDALVADLAPPELRGAAFGLRQALDTVGAFLGPVLAMLLMLAWHDNFRAAFWVAVIPAFIAVGMLQFGVQEPTGGIPPIRGNPLSRTNLARLPRAYWWVVAVGAILTLARFSEAFLVLRVHDTGLALSFTPLVMIVMNVVYSACAYPFGKMADKLPPSKLLTIGILLLIASDIFLAQPTRLPIWIGIVLWGLHMAMTQGLLAALVAQEAPADLRGTAFGCFNLLGGIAMLIASILAGLLWQTFGAPATFIAGAAFSSTSLLLLRVRHRHDRTV